MEKIFKMLKRERTEYILVAILVVFILLKVEIPRVVGTMTNSIVGRVVILIIVVDLLFRHPVLGAVALVAAYTLHQRSEFSTGEYQARKFVPSEYTKNTKLTAHNQFPVTLEEEMVRKMVPFVAESSSSAPPSFTPTQDKLYDAAKL